MNVKILIVDDDIAFVNSIKMFLEMRTNLLNLPHDCKR